MLSTEKNKIYILEFDVLRVLTILLVVAGHSDFLSSHQFSVSNEISEELLSYKLEYHLLRPWIYSFHMPLFMLLSGAVFSLSSNKYSFYDYFRKRYSRLMLPYWSCGLFFSVPLKWLVGYYGNHNIIWAYIESLIFIKSPGHLWFLWVLFIINITFFLIINVEHKNCSEKWGGGTYFVY